MEGTKQRVTALLSFACLVTGLVAIGSGFPTALAATTTAAPSSAPPVNLKTDNGSVAVVVDWSPKEIQHGKDVKFTTNFQDPSSGALFQHVNYNLEVKDASGNMVKSLTNLHTHTGKDVQTITFDKAGNFKLTITVIGLGLTKPFDTSKSGTAETSITVA